ncbi:MAG: polyphenol oxidase family protein [Bdellovibrionales bacterium]|nr:polyphenol oxidase family protein [Bdellovibrionales bacterium]
MSEFLWKSYGSRPCLTFTPDITEVQSPPVVWGFGGSSFFNFDETRELQDTVQCKHSLRLSQVHDSNIISPTREELHRVKSHGGGNWEEPADGWYLAFDEVLESEVVFLLSTADCLPLLFLGKNEVALIHAGWRGLAAGILIKAWSAFRELQCVVIGPAADPKCYEVGEEFKDYFSPQSLTPLLNSSGKFLFNMFLEAELSLRKAGCEKPVFIAPHFTITDQQFYSHRREPENRGRNLSFIAFPRSASE